MDQPTRWAAGLNAWTLRGGNEVLENEVVVMTAGPAASALPATGDITSEAPVSEWSGALALVGEASAALRNCEERIFRLEADAEQREQEYRAELEALQAQLRLARREIERSYEQTAAAMARAEAAEAWLDKLGGTIVNSFGRLATPPQQRRAS